MFFIFFLTLNKEKVIARHSQIFSENMVRAQKEFYSCIHNEPTMCLTIDLSRRCVDVFYSLR